jgi:hypothetical protein
MLPYLGMRQPPTPSEPRVKHQGISDKWELNWRHCENCGKRFKQVQPHQRFCNDRSKPKDFCRKQFHKNGSAFIQLRERISKMLDEKVRETIRPVLDQVENLLARVEQLEKGCWSGTRFSRKR